MLKYKKGNLLDVTEGIIVHGCNCKGVMGSGVAKQIKEKWRDVFEHYADLYWDKGLRLGSIQLIASRDALEKDQLKATLVCEFAKLPAKLVVVNAMTQEEFGKAGKQYVSLTAIAACMLQTKLISEITGLGIHMPKIGAGLGGGAWCDIEHLLNEINIDATVWELP